MKKIYNRPALAEMEIDMESPIAQASVKFDHVSPDIWEGNKS